MACLYQTAKASTMVLIIMVGASCFTGIFLGMGGGKAVVETLTAFGLGKWGLYLVLDEMWSKYKFDSEEELMKTAYRSYAQRGFGRCYFKE
jgi:hypothetical protein